MELRQLEHFLRVLDAGSYRAAATELGLTQQALSKSVTALEKRLGTLLLKRGRDGVSTTELGTDVARRARAIVSECRELRREIDTRLGRFRRTVRIGAGPSVAGNLVANASLQLTKEHSGIRVVVEGGTFYSMLDRLLAGDLDLLITIEPERAARHELISMEKMGDEECVIAARAQHPLAAKTKVRLSDTAKFPWIVGRGMTTLMKSVENAFKEEGTAMPPFSIETTSVDYLRAALAQSNALCILPRHLISLDEQSGMLTALRLQRTWSRPIALSYRRNSTRSPLVLKFIEYLN
jgi:DNA-binding transcriptional LysR family regulator